MIFRINECLVDAHAYEVRRNGKAVQVQPQVLDLLILLLTNKHRLVSKAEIIERIWHGRIVSAAALNSRIRSARQAIGDSGASQELIRTIRGRGYRFVGEASQNPCEPEGDRETTAAPAIRGSTPTTPFRIPDGPAVGVLRFNDASCDADAKFLGYAIAEQIATRLTGFSALRVAAHGLTSECDNADIEDVGRKLGVDFLVRGSLRQAGNRIRVRAHLIKTSNGQLLWAESFERVVIPADMFAAEDDIASKIVAALTSIPAVLDHRKHGFEPSRIALAADGLGTAEGRLSTGAADDHVTLVPALRDT